MYAKVENNVVVGVLRDLPLNYGNHTNITPEIAKTYGILPMVEIKPALNEYQLYGQPQDVITADDVTRTWPVVEISLAAAQEKIKQKITQKREQVERGGTIVSGVYVKTDIESQGKLTGALAFVGRSPNRTIKWKAADNTFVNLTKAQIESLSDGTGEFIAKCYDNEATHYSAVDALVTVASIAAYDFSTGWPV